MNGSRSRTGSSVASKPVSKSASKSPSKPASKPSHRRAASGTSVPIPDDDSFQSSEMFITATEMNGTSHELGWFDPETKVGEVRRITSQLMLVPEEALAIVSERSKSSLDLDESPLADMYPLFPPAESLTAIVQMPARFEERLKCADDVRCHEDAYAELVEFACKFGSRVVVTPGSANLLKRVVVLVCSKLHPGGHPLGRGWAINALAKLLQHSVKQICVWHCFFADRAEQDCSEKLLSTIGLIVETLRQILESGHWLEQLEATDALSKAATELDAFNEDEVPPSLLELLRDAYANIRSPFGGA